MIKKLCFAPITLILISLIVNFSRKVVNLWRAGKLVEEKKSELIRLKTENQSLRKELERVESPRFIEQAAREKLGLGKEGEVAVIMPPETGLEKTPKNLEKPVPNWEKWWRLFVY
jgi:cell division protein FtsB